jgi:hypothetical protein
LAALKPPFQFPEKKRTPFAMREISYELCDVLTDRPLER